MKRVQGKKDKGLNRRLVYATVLVTLILVATLAFYYLFLLPRGTEWTAAIIDQLAVVPTPPFFNPEFNTTCAQLFTAAGYDPRYYAGDEVTIDFYDKLPSKGGRILVVRAHSSVRENTLNVDLYTSEVYQEELALGRYYDLAVNKHISRAYFNYSATEYFAIGPSFVSNVMDGGFVASLIVLMGCKSLNQSSMAEALVSRGATAVVGWTGDVAVSDTDTCIMELLDLLLGRSYTVKGAVDRVNGDHPLSGTRLVYYPDEAWNYVVPTRESETSLTLSQVTFHPLEIWAVGLKSAGCLPSTERSWSYLLIWVSTDPLD